MKAYQFVVSFFVMLIIVFVVIYVMNILWISAEKMTFVKIAIISCVAALAGTVGLQFVRKVKK